MSSRATLRLGREEFVETWLAHNERGANMGWRCPIGDGSYRRSLWRAFPMRSRPRTRSAWMVLCLLALAAGPILGGVPQESSVAGRVPAASKARSAIDRGLAFLEGDAAKWRKLRKCAT